MYRVTAVVVVDGKKKRKNIWRYRTLGEMSKAYSQINEDLLREMDRKEISSFTLDAEFH